MTGVYPNDDPRGLDHPGHQPMLHRLAEASSLVAADFDRVAHVKAVALDVLAARARPRCPQPQIARIPENTRE